MSNNNDNEKIEIISLEKMLNGKEIKLSIPGYQRPYRWSKESAITLISDANEAYLNQVSEYRMGSVILHKENGQDTYNIVDGQQRLTTISIIFFVFGKFNKEYESYSSLLKAKYNKLSFPAIWENLEVIKRKINGMNPNEREGFINYLLKQCTFVKIIVNSEQEAFQFFDSQNSRGKALAPHDLLKSYHLREMKDEPEDITVKIITEWENTEQSDLQDLFSNHLYPLVRWYKGLDGLNYSDKKIKAFKGIKKGSNYNFAVYHRAANLYVEKFNREGMHALISGNLANQFQLTQPLIDGKRFFGYCLHYEKLHKDIGKMIENKFPEEFSKEEVSQWGSGDRYVYDMFVNVLMFYIDKFSWDALTDERLFFLYKWAFSLRVRLEVVYRKSINKYALGQSDKINKGFNIFELIAEMKDPIELDTISFDSISEKDFNKVERYRAMYKKICGEGG